MSKITDLDIKIKNGDFDQMTPEEYDTYKANRYHTIHSVMDSIAIRRLHNASNKATGGPPGRSNKVSGSTVENAYKKPPVAPF
jgi:hypothetical protein